MLRNALTRLFRKKPSEEGPLPDEEIPRYPPFTRGMPVASTDRLLATQQQLLDEIELALGFNDDLRDRLVYPVLRRYAAFVHLLPASSKHHHKGGGGLFRHGLEAAFYATRAAESCEFSSSDTPRRRNMLAPRWRFAAFLGGLVHDLGKPVADMAVTDQEGRLHWDPYRQTLLDWAEANDLERYFLRWNPPHHQRHEAFTPLVSHHVFTEDALSYLSETGPDVIQALQQSLAGATGNMSREGTVLDWAIRQGDQTSVSRDRRTQQEITGDYESWGVPVERYLLDEMRNFLRKGIWSVNDPDAGSRVWVTGYGTFVIWRAAADELVNSLREEGIGGIPRDPDTLADILIEQDLAIPMEQGEGRGSRYWRIGPDSLQKSKSPILLAALRMASNELLFDQPPAPVGAQFPDIDAASETEQADQSDHEGHPEQGGNTAEPSVEATLPADEVAAEGGESGSGQTPEPDVATRSEPARETGSDQGSPDNAPKEQAEGIVPADLVDSSATEEASEAEATLPEEEADEEAESEVADSAEWELAVAEQWLSDKGEVGGLLREVATLLQSGDGSLGWQTGAVYALAHPDIWKALGRKPAEALKMLDQAGWINVPEDALAKVQTLMGPNGEERKALVLVEAPSQALMALLGSDPTEAAEAGEAATPAPEAPARPADQAEAGRPNPSDSPSAEPEPPEPSSQESGPKTAKGGTEASPDQGDESSVHKQDQKEPSGPGAGGDNGATTDRVQLGPDPESLNGQANEPLIGRLRAFVFSDAYPKDPEPYPEGWAFPNPDAVHAFSRFTEGEAKYSDLTQAVRASPQAFINDKEARLVFYSQET